MPEGDSACSKGAPVERIGVSAFTIPTDGPEADGTFAWDSTTMVLVDGALRPDLSRPGLGLELKRSDAERWAVDF
jgi:hypothetical protein